jgi:DNA replicative helicase MCM subunit Mcm2 (Cdc46/Mcm family)
MLTGSLDAGPGARELFGDNAPADAVVFVVGLDGQGVTGYLMLDPESFERAFFTEAGALTIAQGGVVFVVRTGA